MKTGIYGGTFNPPHRGHIQAAEAAVRELGLDRLLIIPAGDPPHKDIPAGSPSAHQRAEMAKLAFSGIECAQLCDIEINRVGLSYTSDTIADIRSGSPDDELYLIMGTDMIETLEHWHDADYILKNVIPAVQMRGVDDDPRVSAASELINEKYGKPVITLSGNVIEISSSQIREELSERRGREYLTDAVYGYIVGNGLYNVSADFDWLRVQSYGWLKQSRIPHVAGCEAEAVNLARRWGADVDKAREAAILHDITKKYELDDQLMLCKKYGIINDELENREYKLLHSKTGAEVAKSEFGVCDDVYYAIMWHTTGRQDMTLLEKIIYMADYIEPTRDFEGLSELRRLAYDDIDAALELGLKMSIEDVLAKGNTPHRRTVEAAEWLSANSKRKGK